MSRYLAIVAVVAMAAGVVSCNGAQSGSGTVSNGGPITLKVSFNGPTSLIYYQWAAAFKGQVETESKGRITVQLYPNNQLGQDPSVIDAIRAGTISMGFVSDVLSQSFPQYGILSAPYVFSSFDQAVAVEKGEAGNKLKAGASNAGLHLLAWSYAVTPALATTKRPVNQLADLKGLKIRTAASQSWTDLMAAWGAVAVPTPSNEVYTALQSGLVDGAMFGPQTLEAGNFNEVTKYLTVINAMWATSALIIGDAYWKQLAAADRQILTDAAVQSWNQTQPLILTAEAKSIQQLSAKGMTILQPDKAPFQRAAASVSKRIAANAGALDILNLIQSTKP
jgi:tripartite ATP-independent transporter DctP family solute receptor